MLSSPPQIKSPSQTKFIQLNKQHWWSKIHLLNQYNFAKDLRFGNLCLRAKKPLIWLSREFPNPNWQLTKLVNRISNRIQKEPRNRKGNEWFQAVRENLIRRVAEHNPPTKMVSPPTLAPPTWIEKILTGCEVYKSIDKVLQERSTGRTDVNSAAIRRSWLRPTHVTERYDNIKAL